MVGLKIFILVLLAAHTGASTQGADEVNIVFTHENPSFGVLLDEYNWHHEHQVRVTWVDQSDLKSRLVEIKNVADIPDLLIIPSDSLGMDKFVQFSEIPTPLISNELSDKALQTSTINDRILGVPIVQGNHLILYYSKRFIESPAANWEALINQQQSLPQDVSLIDWSFMEMYWFVPFITAFGDGPVIEDNPNLDTNAMRDALSFVWGLANSGVVDQTCNYTCAEQNFLNDRSAYVINGIWSYQHYKDELGDDLGIAPLPMIGQRRMQPYFSTIVAAFPRKSLSGPKQEALQSVLRYLQSESFQKKLWYSIQEIPANEMVLNSLLNDSNTQIGTVLATLQYTLPMSSHRNMAIIWEVILKGYLRFGSGIWSAERASRYMQDLALEHIVKDTD